MKKFAAIVLALVLCAALVCTASADPALYFKKYTTEEITQNTFHNGFVTALGGVENNVLTLNEDGTYIYIKQINTEDENGNVVEGDEENPALLLIYTFTGTYEQDGDTVVLAFPTSVIFSENWGALASMGYFLNSEGAATFADGEISGDNVQCKEDEGHVAFDIFPGAYMNDSLVTSDAGFDAEETTVTITLSGDSFDYVIVNSDDD